MATSTTPQIRRELREHFGVTHQRVTAEAKRAGLTTDEWYAAEYPILKSVKEQRSKAARRVRYAANRQRINESAKTNRTARREAMREAVAKLIRESAAKIATVKARGELRKRRKVDAASTIQRFWRQAMARRAIDSNDLPEVVRRKYAATPNVPFELVVRSAISPSIMLTFKFKGMPHFNNWVAARLRQDGGKLFGEPRWQALPQLCTQRWWLRPLLHDGRLHSRGEA